jgi:hypothetical protein
VSALAIPKEHERGFAVIKLLSGSDVNQISQVLNESSPASNPASIVSALRPVLPGYSEDDVEKLVDAIYSLYFFRSSSDVPIEQFLVDLSEAIKESENKEIQTTNPDELAILESKFKSLLTIRSLSTQAKARGLRSDFAKIFSDAKIICDIRPVWDGSVKEPPEGIVITQTLKVEYFDIDGAEELYLKVDREDIEQLISVLMRAREKMATLKSLATVSWMKILDQ